MLSCSLPQSPAPGVAETETVVDSFMPGDVWSLLCFVVSHPCFLEGLNQWQNCYGSWCHFQQQLLCQHAQLECRLNFFQICHLWIDLSLVGQYQKGQFHQHNQLLAILLHPHNLQRTYLFLDLDFFFFFLDLDFLDDFFLEPASSSSNNPL